MQRPYSVLAEAEVATIIEAGHTIRDQALLAVMLGAGLCVSEVVALDVTDVLTNQEGGAALCVRQGKGRRDRVVPIQPKGRAVGLSPAPAAGSVKTVPCSAPTTQEPASATAAASEQAPYGPSCGDAPWQPASTPRKISSHVLRHTFAIPALRGSDNIMAVKELLGHSALSTTQRYLATSSWPS